MRASRRRFRRRPSEAPLVVALACALVAAGDARGAVEDQVSPEALSRLSIEELANIQISSVSKTIEPLSEAPAAIYVISHDDIMHAGAHSIPEILRLAPNLQVAQVGATNYAISARGSNGQFADKLLVLIDGRSVYSPLFAGVFWDVQNVLPEDIERVEVISGPGATLWGANAVNGVINIITRKSADTQGGVLDLGAGNLERQASVQYGGKLSDDLAYRVYTAGYDASALNTATGTSAHDAWSKQQGGFRLDWTPGSDSLMLQGDFYHQTEAQLGAPDLFAGGGDLVARWDHPLADGAALQFLAYYDETKRFTDNGGGGELLDTYNIEVQHSFTLGGWNDIVWGVGDRVYYYRIVSIPALIVVPANATRNLVDLFAQDTISLSSSVKFTAGLKLEDEPFSGLELLPSGRLSWKLDDTTLLWSAISRAVRAPTPFDDNIQEKQGSLDILNGSPSFRPEQLVAYEIGTRVQPTPRTSFSVSTFYDRYDDLRSIELAPDGKIFPLVFGNRMQGVIYGVEAWGSYRATDWWRLTASFNIQHEHLQFTPQSSRLGGTTLFGDDPNHQASLRSSIDLGGGVSWDADFRYVGALPNPAIASYAELSTKVNWQISQSLDLSVSAYNLLHAHHVEFSENSVVEEVPRSFFVETRWRF